MSKFGVVQHGFKPGSSHTYLVYEKDVIVENNLVPDGEMNIGLLDERQISYPPYQGKLYV